MGRAVYFYTTSKEFKTLLQVIQDKGLLAVPSYAPTEEYYRDNIKAVSPVNFNYENTVMYLIPKEIPIENVFFYPTYDPSLSYLRASVSPVIEIGIYESDSNIVMQNRIYTNYPLDAPYSKLLYAAFNRISRYIKKWPSAGKAYIAPETYELAKKKEVELEGISI